MSRRRANIMRQARSTCSNRSDGPVAVSCGCSSRCRLRRRIAETCNASRRLHGQAITQQKEKFHMAKSNQNRNRGGNRTRGKNNNPEGRNQYNSGLLDMARERPAAAAAAAAGRGRGRRLPVVQARPDQRPAQPIERPDRRVDRQYERRPHRRSSRPSAATPASAARAPRPVDCAGGARRTGTTARSRGTTGRSRSASSRSPVNAGNSGTTSA